MAKDKHPEIRPYEDCIEDCYFASKICYEKADGTPVCPFDFQKCAEDCRKQYLS